MKKFLTFILLACFVASSVFAEIPKKVKVSEDDTTAGYLNGKLVAGTGVAFTENNNGGNETLTLAVSSLSASGINWSSLSQHIQSSGINWSSVPAETIQRSQINWSNLWVDSASGVNWGAIPGAVTDYVLTKTASGVNWQASAGGGGAGTVDTANTPNANEFARFTDADTIEGRTYAEAKADLDLEIGTDVQAYDADLTTYAGITPSANIQSLLGSADYSAARTNLGLAIGTNVQAYDADLTTYAGITPSANVQSLLGSANYAAMRTLLDLEAGTDFYSIAATDSAIDTDVATHAALTATHGVAGAVVGTTDSQALTNKTIDGDLNTLQDILYSQVKSTSRSGVDVTLVTGTKGATDDCAKWNADGDLVSAGAACGTGGGGGDNVLINGGGVTDPDFVSTGQVSFTDTSNTITANIVNDSILEADLKAVDVAADEDILTYESTTGDFEWHSPTDLEASFEAVLDLSDLQGAVTDAQVPNTITVDLATVATTANAGDSATSFFSSGTVEAARLPDADDDGSTKGVANFTNADFDATAGAVSIASAITRDTEWDTEGEVQTAWGAVNILLETEIDASSELRALMDDESGTGALIFADGALGAATATTASADDNDTSVATTAYVQTEINAAGGRGVTCASGSCDADAELYTDTKCIRFESPVAADDLKSLWINDSANQMTVTKLWCESDQTVTAMLQVDDGTPADMDSVDLVCITTPDTDTSLNGDATIAAGDRVDIDIASVSGTPTWVSYCFTGTWDD